MSEAREKLIDEIEAAGFSPDEVVRFDSPQYDDAAVGITDEGRLVYDYDLMVKSLAAQDGISDDEAAEFIDYNAMRSLPYVGKGAPIVFHRFSEEGQR